VGIQGGGGSTPDITLKPIYLQNGSHSFLFCTQRAETGLGKDKESRPLLLNPYLMDLTAAQMHRDRGFHKMRAPIVCMVFLFLAHEGLCSDADQEQKGTEEEFLNSLFALKVSRPQWKTPLLDACGLIHSLTGRGQEAWLSNKEGLLARENLSTETLEGLYDLENLCRILQPREVFQEYLDSDFTHNSENPPKRKSPYILKRQVHTSKTRRPYILKRNAYY
ncbi:hypothetical protein AAFF_G00029630, partial [Aldrovandia affinis]